MDYGPIRSIEAPTPAELVAGIEPGWPLSTRWAVVDSEEFPPESDPDWDEDYKP